MTETYYSLLNIDENASEETINQAYRELVKETHPDVSDDPRARERMAELTQARDVLTDQQKRARYDVKHDISPGTAQDTGKERTTSTHSRSRAQEDRRTRQSHRESSETSTASDFGSSSESARDARSQRRRRRTTRTNSRNQTGSQTTSRTKTTNTVPVWIRLRYLPQQTRRIVRLACGWALTFVFGLLYLEFLGFAKWKKIRSFLISKTAIRLMAGFSLWWGLSYFSRVLDFGNPLSPTDQVLLLIVVFLGSYLGYDLIIHYSEWGVGPSRRRFQPNETARLWPIVVVNLLGIGLVYWGLKAGALLGGVGFAITSMIGFVIYMLIFGWSILIFAIVVGSELNNTFIEKGFVWVGLLAPLSSAVVLFTSYGRGILGTIVELHRNTQATVHPWVGPGLVGQVGPIYGDALLNFIIGTIMIGSFAWSLKQVYSTLTEISWNDRFKFGYRTTPGFWHFLTFIPAVIIVWMILNGEYVIPVIIGTTTTSVRIDHMIIIFGASPTWVTGLYILRRQAEPFLQKSLWSR